MKFYCTGVHGFEWPTPALVVNILSLTRDEIRIRLKRLISKHVQNCVWKAYIAWDPNNCTRKTSGLASFFTVLKRTTVLIMVSKYVIYEGRNYYSPTKKAYLWPLRINAWIHERLRTSRLNKSSTRVLISTVSNL